MAQKTIRQYGLWDSPLTPSRLSEERRLDKAQWDTDGQTLVWWEGRSGKGVLAAQGSEGDAPRDLTAGFDVRAELGYGGGDFTVSRGAVYFVVKESGQIRRQPLGGGPSLSIAPAFGKSASPVVSPDGRWIAYVHEDDEQRDRIAVVDAGGEFWPQILTSGHDFYMQPRWSPDGRFFAWVAWDHPNMPWDGATLFLAPLTSTAKGPPTLGTAQAIAGGPEIAVFQPEFSADGRHLFFVSDETGWGRIAMCDLHTGDRQWLTPNGVEHASPAWAQDMRTYAVGHDGRYLAAARNQRGVQQIHRIDLCSGDDRPVEALSAYTEIAQLNAAPHGEQIVFTGSGPTFPPRIVLYDFAARASRIVARSGAETIGAASLAACEPLTWTTAGGELAHGLYYRPNSERFAGAGKPPLVVLIHGGPTHQARAGWRPDVQFLATRGYAVLLVNYRGGTGYGREYMLKLRGNWGVCDVEDAVSGARHLSEIGETAPKRAAIMGGSAGGFTVLQTMIQHPYAFMAGVCLYGVADQFELAAKTHKMESHYLDSLLGPLPEAASVYRQRSPVFHAEKIRRPLAVFQGDIDRVVPRSQADSIVDALKRAGAPHVYHVYEGEGHGWRKRETIEHFYQAVDDFLRRHVVFADANLSGERT